MDKDMNKIWEIIESTAYFFISLLFKIIHKELTEEFFQAIMQFIKFGIVGLSNTVISYVLYAGSLLLLKQTTILKGKEFLTAQIIAFILSVAWSFYWNNKMVFSLNEDEERSLLHSLFKTYVSYSFTGLFLNTLLLILWVQLLNISEFIAPIFNLVISVPINFFINKYWTFKNN